MTFEVYMCIPLLKIIKNIDLEKWIEGYQVISICIVIILLMNI